MATVNGPQYPKLSLGRPVKLGTITTSSDALQFSIPWSQLSTGSGTLILQAITKPTPLTSTVTAFTADLRFALDGTTYMAQAGNIGGSTMASSTNNLDLHGPANVGTIVSVQIPSNVGGGSVIFQVTALTLGSATSIDIWAQLG